MPKFRRSLVALASLLAAAATLAACGDDSTAPAALTVTATAVVEGEPSVLRTEDGMPYLQCLVGVTAITTGSGEGEWIGATLRWYAGVERAEPFDSVTLGYSDVVQGWREGLNLVPGQPRTSRWQMAASVPFYGDIELRYRRRGGSARSTTASFRCGPSIPPGAAAPAVTALAVDAPAGPLEVGDTLTVTYTATSPASLWRSAVALQGACDTLVDFVEPLATSTSRTVRIALPPRCQLGVPISVGVAVLDGAARTATRSLATGLSLTDLTPPTFVPMYFPPGGGSATTGPLTGTLFVGDSLALLPMAYDAGGVAWLVWEVLPSGQRDSVPMAGVTWEVKIPVRESWAGMTGLRLRARDRFGNESAPGEIPRGALVVGADRPRTVRSLAVSGEIRTAAYDRKRNVVYLRQSNERRIRVVDLATMTLARTIELDAYGPAMDITAGGDSLLVGLPRAIGVIDLRAATPTITQVPVDYDPAVSYLGIERLLAMANGHALFTIGGAGTTAWKLFDLDLATGTITERTDMVPWATMVRSSDHRVLVAQSNGGPFARWTVDTDAFASAPGAARSNGSLAVDATGSLVATDRHLYDGSLAWLRTVQSPWGECSCVVPTALSPDGTYLYFAAGGSVGNLYRSRTSDGQLLDRTRYPLPPAPDSFGWFDTLVIPIPGSEKVIVTYSRTQGNTPGAGAVVLIE